MMLDPQTDWLTTQQVASVTVIAVDRAFLSMWESNPAVWTNAKESQKKEIWMRSEIKRAQIEKQDDKVEAFYTLQ